MTNRTRQSLATILFGAVLATAFIIVAPRVFATQATPAVADVPASFPMELAAVETPLSDDTAVDMTHWQETAVTPTPYVPGKTRKGK